LTFVRGLIALRKTHACLRRDLFLTGEDLVWHGTEVGKPDFGAGSRCLAWRLRGQQNEDGQSGPDLYTAFNFWREPVDFRLPDAGKGSHWRLLLSTADGLPPRQDPVPVTASAGLLRLEAFSLVVLSRHTD
jgi:glycogen operon protein